MGDDLCCEICQSKETSAKDLLKHIEDVLDLKPYDRDDKEKEPVTFEDIDKQIVVKCRESPGIKNVVPLKQYKLEGDLSELKSYLDRKTEELKKLVRRQRALRGSVNQILEDINLSRWLTETNYVNRFHILLWIEEHYARKELEIHNQRDVKLITEATSSKPSLYGIDVLGLSDGRPSLIINDHVRIHKEHNSFVEENTKLEKYHVYEGLIEDIKKDVDKIYVGPNANKFEYESDEKVGVEFVLNRRPYQLSHRALDQLKIDPTLYRTLFPKKPPNQPKQKIQPMKYELEFVNKKISNDNKQKQAIGSIIGKTSGSAPYILIGPPGTGKTATIIEVIYQLWKRSKSTSELPKICICAPSNPAIDVIVKRLLGRDGLEDDCPMLPPGLQENVIRVYAKTAERDKNLLDCSTNEVNVEVLQEKRIVATTTVTAGWMVDKGFGKKWFDYIFIDEAGQATETNILIPIAGFLHDKCHLVLAGDPKQLGPVVVSPLAQTLGLDVSLMERLKPSKGKGKSIYGNRWNRNAFLFTTALNNNYRSHPKIIQISNKKFYHGTLKAKGEAKKIFLASDSDWDKLNKRNTPRYPIIFHGVEGRQQRDGSSPSFFNIEEIIEVKNYIDDLLGRVLSGVTIEPEHIGIISPYRNQVEKINKYLNHRKLNGIRVGSIESFQGSEKPIIIISTVRSKRLGFLKNERRFNVAVTRAIAALIVIGHPDVLYTYSGYGDPNYWRELIDECYRFHSCKGKLPGELEEKKLTKVTAQNRRN